jgi:hypothetical protein
MGGNNMSASPFIIRTSRREGVLRCEIWNDKKNICVKHFTGRTAKRRAMFWLEALQVGYFSR